MSKIKSLYKEDDIKQWCRYANISYDTWITNYQKLEKKFQIIDIVNSSKENDSYSNNSFNQKIKKLNGNESFSISNFSNTTSYAYDEVKTVKDHTLYSINQNELKAF
ncbi:MAG: hypothetical protein K6E76_08390 [Patescibacteria group bacterium]|nr:hypothetical protein [Patescibacteria group bacterium]